MKCGINFSSSYHWKDRGVVFFNLLPSIELFRDNVNDDIGDYSLDISFGWLFWFMIFTVYWGSVYKKERSNARGN